MKLGTPEHGITEHCTLVEKQSTSRTTGHRWDNRYTTKQWSTEGTTEQQNNTKKHY